MTTGDLADAIGGLRSAGFTWDELGAEVGMSKQALSQCHKRRSDVNNSFTDSCQQQRAAVKP